MELDLFQKFGIKGKRKTVLYPKGKNSVEPKEKMEYTKGFGITYINNKRGDTYARTKVHKKRLGKSPSSL